MMAGGPGRAKRKVQLPPDADRENFPAAARPKSSTTITCATAPPRSPVDRLLAAGDRLGLDVAVGLRAQHRRAVARPTGTEVADQIKWNRDFCCETDLGVASDEILLTASAVSIHATE
jgi:hypothetical protein